jgi:endonuclease YncB( thermonuclease family)
MHPMIPPKSISIPFGNTKNMSILRNSDPNALFPSKRGGGNSGNSVAVRISIFLSLLCGVVFFAPAFAYPSSWSGKVISVNTDDTLVVLKHGKGCKVKLYGIDTPEKGQAFGKEAIRFIKNRVSGKSVKVVQLTIDRKGRVIGVVYTGVRSLNEELIRRGLAWLVRNECRKPFCHDWRALENLARKKRTGLWTDKNPVPPETFRRKQRRNKRGNALIKSYLKPRPD